jgi:hypothetical protein
MVKIGHQAVGQDGKPKLVDILLSSTQDVEVVVFFNEELMPAGAAVVDVVAATLAEVGLSAGHDPVFLETRRRSFSRKLGVSGKIYIAIRQILQASHQSLILLIINQNHSRPAVLGDIDNIAFFPDSLDDLASLPPQIANRHYLCSHIVYILLLNI